MRKIILLINILTIGTAALLKANNEEPILLKQSCKIFNHGFFIFCTKIDHKTINRTTFSYSLNLRKQLFAVGFVERDTISIDAISKSELHQFSNSDQWNIQRIGTKLEKYYLIFHQDFLKWNNSEKLNFFVQVCENKCATP